MRAWWVFSSALQMYLVTHYRNSTCNGVSSGASVIIPVEPTNSLLARTVQKSQYQSRMKTMAGTQRGPAARPSRPFPRVALLPSLLASRGLSSWRALHSLQPPQTPSVAKAIAQTQQAWLCRGRQQPRKRWASGGAVGTHTS